MENTTENSISLGGEKINLQGFSELDPAAMVVLRKIIGNHYHRLNEISNATELVLQLKRVHEREHSEKYELHARLSGEGKMIHAEITDRNLYFAVDKVLKRLEAEIEK